ncbi:hypothetical protein MRX96_021597 [Rhipicephalus microplus]
MSRSLLEGTDNEVCQRFLAHVFGLTSDNASARSSGRRLELKADTFPRTPPANGERAERWPTAHRKGQPRRTAPPKNVLRARARKKTKQTETTTNLTEMQQEGDVGRLLQRGGLAEQNRTSRRCSSS